MKKNFTNVMRAFAIVTAIFIAGNAFAMNDPLFVVPSEKFPTLSSALDSVKNSPLLNQTTIYVLSGTHIVAGEYTMSMSRPVQITVQGEGAASTWIAGYEDADYNFLTTNKRFLVAHQAADNGLDLIFTDISFKNFGVTGTSSNGFIRAGNVNSTTKFSFINCNFKSITARVNAVIANTGNIANETLFENCSFSNVFSREANTFDAPVNANAGKLTVRNSTFYNNIKDPRNSTTGGFFNIDRDRKVGTFFGISSVQDLEVIFENNVFINNQTVPEGGAFVHPVIAIKNGNNDKVTTITMNDNIFIGNIRDGKVLDCDIYIEDSTTVIFNSLNSGNIANRVIKRTYEVDRYMYKEGSLPGFKIANGFTYDHEFINFSMDANSGLPLILADTLGVDYAEYSGDGGDFVTNQVTEITSTTATLNAVIFNVSDPAPSQHGFVWGQAPEPTITDDKIELGAVTEANAFSSEIISFIPNKLYYVRAYLTNDAGTVYGGQVKFATAPLAVLSISGTLSAEDKTYDGNVSATIDTTQLSLSGLVSGFENVTLSNVVAEFGDSAISTENKTVTIVSAELSGSDAGLYTFTLTGSPTGEAKISTVELTIEGTFTVLDKLYNGDVSATISEANLTLAGLIPGHEDVSLDNMVVEFIDAASSIDNKVVTIVSAQLLGANAGIYSLSLTGAPTGEAKINAIELTITGSFTAKDKDADGTADAEILENNLVLTGVLGTEIVELVDVLLAFSQTSPGVDLIVSITSAGLSGTDMGNYTLSLDNAPTALATINDPTGIKGSDAGGLAYPNPFTDIIYLSSHEIVNVSLTNITGQKVLEKKMKGDVQLSTAHLHRGLYYLTLENINGSKMVVKMVKQ